MKNMKTAKYYTPKDNNTVVCLDFLDKNSLVFAGYTFFVLDDNQAYKEIVDKIQNDNKQKPLTMDDVCKTVQNYVLDYFGVGATNPNGYIQRYRLASDRNEYVTLSSLKNTRLSQCIERSTFAHDIFKQLNINCALVASNINFDGQEELHSFNVLNIKDEYYVFDLICSKVSNDKQLPSPIMCKLPKEVGKQIFEQKLLQDFKTQDVEFITQSGYKHKIRYEFIKTKNLENTL